MAFKLTFYDDIINMDTVKNKKAEYLLRRRIIDAKEDLDKFLEGLDDE